MNPSPVVSCPTCFAVREQECSPDLRWCSATKIKCLEFFDIVDTGAFLGRDTVQPDESVCLTVRAEKAARVLTSTQQCSRFTE